MLGKIKELLRSFQLCSLPQSETDLTLISWSSDASDLEKGDCFVPGICTDLRRERKTDYFVTWYAKDCFFDRFFNKGTALFDSPWKSVVLVPYTFNRCLYLIFVDIYSLQHKIYKSHKRKSWKSICRLMLETEYRPAKLVTQYKQPFRSREFEYFTRSCGYIMSGGNSQKFLQNQVQSFDQVLEIIEKVKYIVTNSSTVGYDLTLLQYFVSREHPQKTDNGHYGTIDNESMENDCDERKVNKRPKTSLRFDDHFRFKEKTRQKAVAGSEVKDIPLEIQCADENDLMNLTRLMLSGLRPFCQLNCALKAMELLCIDMENEVNTVGRIKEYPVLEDEYSFKICKREYSTFSILRGERKKVTFKFSPRCEKAENKLTLTELVSWESVVLQVVVSHGKHIYIFMDVDSCYPHVITAENDSNKISLPSFVSSCMSFFQAYTKPKELHVIDKKPFDSEEFKNFILTEGISYFTNSPILEYLKKPSAFFSVILRVISTRGHHDSKIKLLQDFVRNELIKEGTRMSNDLYWKKVIGAKMTTSNGSFFLFIDIENNLVDASPKIPVKSLSTQEVILACFEEFTERGIPEELHTCGGPLFTADEFKLLVDYCNITHCSDCPLLNKSSKFFKTFLKISCCFERTSNVCSGLELWSSLRKRLVSSEIMQRNKIPPHHPNEKYGPTSRTFDHMRKHSKKIESKHKNQKMRLAKVIKMLIDQKNGFGAAQLLSSCSTLSKRSRGRNVSSLSSRKVNNTSKRIRSEADPNSEHTEWEKSVCDQLTKTRSAKYEDRKRKKKNLRHKPKNDMPMKKIKKGSPLPIAKDGQDVKDVENQQLTMVEEPLSP